MLGTQFQSAIFTNLTQDHLDYHRNMDAYFAAKARLFEPEYLQGKAIVNQDDACGRKLIEMVGQERSWRYSLQDAEADLYVSELVYKLTGVDGRLHTPQGETDFFLPLLGHYNLQNMLAAVGAALHAGIDLQHITKALAEFPGVPGRMERVEIQRDQDISVIVDYAHTPDSLKNVLQASRPYIQGRALCVFGCGGDRDRTKRPQMGQIAAELADIAIVTSDNPRTEEPDRILQDILKGIPSEAKPVVIADRAEAIRHAIAIAQPGDGIVIAGKGHEDYQIFGTEKVHFDDREQAREALQKRHAIPAH